MEILIALAVVAVIAAVIIIRSGRDRGGPGAGGRPNGGDTHAH